MVNSKQRKRAQKREKKHVERIEKSNKANSNLTTHIYFAAFFAFICTIDPNQIQSSLSLSPTALNFQFYSMNMG